MKSNSHARSTSKSPHYDFDWVAARGGCDLQAMSHYFKVNCSNVTGEFNVGRSGFDARIDHSVFLRCAIEGMHPVAIKESAKLGYRPEDFQSSILSPHAGNGLVVLSFWSDVSYALYRHRRLNFLLPFALSGRSNHALDARDATVNNLPDNLRSGWMAAALRTLQDDYDFVGLIDEASFKDNLNVILGRLTATAPVVILQANTCLLDREHGVIYTSAENVKFNKWISEASKGLLNVTPISVRELILNEDEVSDWSHFHRIVYYRLFERISQTLGLYFSNLSLKG